MKKSTQRILRFITRLILNIISQIKVEGVEHIPTGGYIVAGNHIGRLDAAFIYYVLDRPDIVVVVAEKYEKVALFRALVKLVNGIFVDRYNADIHALREPLRRLRQGHVFGVTPEGTRSKSGNLLEGRPGAIYLAWKAGVPILPVAVTGSEDAVAVRRLKRLKRLDILINIGTPFSLPAQETGLTRDEFIKKYTEEVMCQIALLLPAERRGIYAEHPRLKDLLACRQAII